MAKLTPYQDEDGLWRIDGVSMVETGIEYPAATGPVTFTQADLEAAVGALDDIAIVQPRVKLGHTSNYNKVLVGDAEQAFGRWENMELSDNHQTIYGDIVGIPEWLAKVMPIAYPNRSVEVSFDVETVTGNEHKMVITAVAQLGVRWPGCQVLEDLPLYYGADIPADVEVDGDTAEIAASIGGGMRLGRDKKDTQAAVDVSLIRRKFYNDGPGAEDWNLWIRGERFDTDEGLNLIVDMGTGELARYSVSVDGSEIEFGDPILVTEEYPDKAVAASAVLAGMKMADPAMVIHASRAETDDRPKPQSTEEGGALDEETRKKLAASAGLSEDATEEQINAKLQETALADPVTPQPVTQGGTGTEGLPVTPPDPDPAKNTETAIEAVGGATAEAGVKENDDGTVTLDKSAYELLHSGATLAIKNDNEAKKERISNLVEAAVGDGRIPPARRDHWTKQMTADFEGAQATLATLEPGTIPVSLRGNTGNSEEGSAAGSGEGLPDIWFPGIAQVRAAAAEPKNVLIAKEG